MALIINHLSKSFGEHIVLKDFNADIPTGQVTLLTAPSGKGKTTLLRILMGLETADSGEFSDFQRSQTKRSFSGRSIMRKFKRIIQH